jgi:two-component system LytT family response regulator
MNPLRAIIVDDEDLARRGLSVRLRQLPDVDVIAECSNGREALKAINEEQPELVFLDIQMPGMNGFDVISELQGDDLPMVVFVTAYDHYAVDAFRVHAVDYVLKPIDDDRLHEAVERAMAFRDQSSSTETKEKLIKLVMSMTGESAGSVERMLGEEGAAASYPEKITIRDGQNIQILHVNRIQWVDAAGDYMCIHCDGKTHIMRITMKQLEDLLNPALFVRIHRSTIVNQGMIAGAQTLPNGEYLLNLEDGTQLKVSRSYRDRIRDLLTTR